MKLYVSKLALIAALFTLSACKSAEERAEERYQSGLELLADGDAPRAILEFRNVMEFEPNHVGARTTLAEILLDQGNRAAAYRQILHLAEQFPTNGDFRLTLAKLAFSDRNWEEFQRHGRVAVEQKPEAEDTPSIELGMRYQTAVVDNDATARAQLAEEAGVLVSSQPNNEILRSILADYYTANANVNDAIEQLDRLIELNPERRDAYEQKLALIAKSEDPERIEGHLLEMISAFPDDQDLKARLLRFYASLRDLDKAEEFLRSTSSPADEDTTNFLSLIRFLGEVRGDEAALVEIERGIAQNPNKVPFQALRAAIQFQNGETADAISEMEQIISTNEPSAELRGIQVGLAQMLVTTGNEVGARRLVEEVLAADSLNVEALKMQANWQLAADDPDAAILSLRTAVDSAPDDTEALEALSKAYVRVGKMELSREYLLLAVEASGNAPEQSIAYANALIQREQYLPAESVLITALRLAPRNPRLLATMGRLYIAMEDAPRTTQVIDTLRRISTDQTIQIANALRAEQLQNQNGIGEAVAFLEELASTDDAGLDAQIMLLRGHLAAGNSDAAELLITDLQAEYPGNLNLSYAVAAVKGASGDLEGAAADYRKLLDSNPRNPRVWLELSRVLERQGDRDAAEAAITEGLAQNDNNPNLLWARASILETENRIEEAIAIYETLYERAPDSIIVANNLASLLSSYREDQESLDRAFDVARRFSETEIPALQDTYGWILHRTGESNTALPYLESAAAALTDDALTQYHLAIVYLELGMTEKAVKQMQFTLDVAGPADTRPQIEAARAKLAELREATTTAN